MEISDLFRISASLTHGVTQNFSRFNRSLIDWSLPMLCVKGARGVGKTTMLLQELAARCSGEQGLYVSLDNLWFTEHRLLDLVDYHYQHGGTHAFLDEVHRYPYANWVQELKNIYDSYPGYHVAFTGSSLLRIDSSQADLSRRCIFYDLQGLSFREYLNFTAGANLPAYPLEDIIAHHVSIASDIAAKVPSPLQHFPQYLQHGYYPFYAAQPTTYFEALRQIINTIIEGDLPASVSIEKSTMQKFKRLLYIISQRAPFSPNISNLAHALATNRASVYEMLGTLAQAALITNLYAGKDVFGQLSKPEKVYLENTNLMYALAPSPEVGHVRETFFANQLKQGHSITFTGQGDFIVDGRYTFEVGGARKSFEQIKDVTDSFLAVDDVSVGHGHRIPLWLFGFLY